MCWGKRTGPGKGGSWTHLRHHVSTALGARVGCCFQAATGTPGGMQSGRVQCPACMLVLALNAGI